MKREAATNVEFTTEGKSRVAPLFWGIVFCQQLGEELPGRANEACKQNTEAVRRRSVFHTGADLRSPGGDVLWLETRKPDHQRAISIPYESSVSGNHPNHHLRTKPGCFQQGAFARHCAINRPLCRRRIASIRGSPGIAGCCVIYGLTLVQSSVKHSHRMQILIAEDEKKLADALQKGLEAEKHSVRIADTGEEAFFLVSTERFDLLLLDLMLPGRDGIEILKALRQKDRTVPVLILTSKNGIEDRVQGLDAGADDYLVKPISFPELLARVRALARRTNMADAKATLKLGGLEMDLLRHSASREGRELALTSREFGLLEYLLRHQGHIVSREMIARDVWNESGRYTPLDNVIDVHIARLRQKLDGPFGKKLLHTIRGVGFVLREEV